MATRPALNDLSIFVNEPTLRNASRLVSIPVVHDVLKYEEVNNAGLYSTTFLRVCKWLHERGSAVLAKLIVHDSPPNVVMTEGIDWQKVRLHAYHRPDTNILQEWLLL
jgi:hypothetical protein